MNIENILNKYKYFELILKFCILINVLNFGYMNFYFYVYQKILVINLIIGIIFFLFILLTQKIKLKIIRKFKKKLLKKDIILNEKILLDILKSNNTSGKIVNFDLNYNIKISYSIDNGILRIYKECISKYNRII